MRRVLLMLCDQTKLTAAHLDALIDAFARRPDLPAASAYAGSRAFPRSFPARCSVNFLLDGGQRGETAARGVRKDLSLIPWPGRGIRRGHRTGRFIPSLIFLPISLTLGNSSSPRLQHHDTHGIHLFLAEMAKGGRSSSPPSTGKTSDRIPMTCTSQNTWAGVPERHTRCARA